MHNPQITYTIKCLKGKRKGETIVVVTDLDALEEEGLDMILIHEGYFDEMGWSFEYYQILERRVGI